MKHSWITVVIAFLLGGCLIAVASEPIRTWRTKSGGQMEATWDTSLDTGGNEIRLQKEGKKYKIQLEKLIDEDQRYIEKRRTELAEESTEATSDFILEEEQSDTESRAAAEGESAIPNEMETEPPVEVKANKKYALLVGVNDYEKLSSLSYAANDVMLIRDQLLDMGFDPNHIFTLATGLGASSKPTKRLIEGRVSDILKAAGSEDMIFIAFAGHGVQVGDTAYFCPEDTQDEIVESAVSINQIMKELERSKARFKWMVIDACRTNPTLGRRDPFAGRNPNARSLQKLESPPHGMMLFQSCANMEQSFEDEQYKHGLFSYNFVNGLKGAADLDGDGKLTLMEICKYTTDRTVDESRQRFHASQRPYMSGEVSDFIIVDDLLIEGITREEWRKADALYQEACTFRRSRKFKEAKAKIDEARKINQVNKDYQLEEEDITGQLAAEEEIVRKIAAAAAAARKQAEEEAARKIAEAEAAAVRKIAEAEADATPANPASDFEYTKSDGEVTITKLKNKKMEGEIVIPRTIDGLPVTSIRDSAFSHCEGLTSVTIPASVTNIGDWAFWSCDGLTSLTIPASVTSIGEYAFPFCSGLTSLTIPASVTSIGEKAFYWSGGLTSIEVASGNAYYQSIDGVLFTKDGKTIHSYSAGKKGSSYRIPEGVTSIGAGAFAHCSDLTSLTIPTSVTSIGEEAFNDCDGLTSLTIPASVTSIGEEAFSSCYSLTSLTIPEGVTSIGEKAFYWSGGLTSIEVASGNAYYQSIDGVLFTKDGKTIHSYPAGKKGSYRIPASVTSIGDSAFAGCDGLTSLTIPASVTSIGNSAFAGCDGLTSLTIPASVTSIGDWAFSDCSGLTSLTIPASVTSIGGWAFSDCDKLTIRTPKGSAAEKYAKEEGIKFVTTSSSSR